MKGFRAIVTDERNGTFTCAVTMRDMSSLPEGTVLIRTAYSSLNYKDALSAAGNRGITKKYPHTPGIDAAGIVVESADANWKAGDEVLVTGYDLGMDTSGGFAEFIRVPADWVVRKPAGLSLRECMTFGTAGFTAALALYQLELNGLTPAKGNVLVTGATGGVGSLAVALLTNAGYSVTASTRKEDKYQFLKSLGAKEIIPTAEMVKAAEKPLHSGRWAGVIDTVGGTVLAGALSASLMFASVAVCGLTASPAFNTTVYPFVIRGNNLLGINSASTPMLLRAQLWERLSRVWKPALPEGYVTVCTLEETIEKIPVILRGGIAGRVLITTT
jgi:putative YhdH/YhfP family quinone oxidoreductase